MNNDEIIRSLQQTEDRTLRNESRIKELEENYSMLHELATSVAVMATQLKTLNVNVAALQADMGELKSKPAQRWDAVVDRIIWALVAAVVAYALGRIGL